MWAGPRDPGTERECVQVVGGGFAQAWLRLCGVVGVGGTVLHGGKADFLLDVFLSETGHQVSDLREISDSHLKFANPNFQSTKCTETQLDSFSL